MTESLFSHAAQTSADTTTNDEFAEPVTMPVFSHLGRKLAITV